MFSFSLFLQNGTSQGILDKDDKVCSLLACFFMLHFLPSQAFPTPLLGTMRNTRTPLMHPTLGNHEKHPKPFSCFIFGLPHHSHNTLGNHEKHPPLFSCFIFNNYSWEPWETPQPLFMLHFLHSETLPTPLLGATKHPNPFSCFILAFPSPSQTLPTPLLGTMKHATLFSYFILGLPRPFPDPSHPTLGNHEAPKPFFMLHFAPSQALPTPLLGTVNLFLMLQTLPTPLLGTMRNTHPLFHVSLKGVGSSAAAIAFVDQRNLQPQKFPSFPPHAWEPWSTQTLFHASFFSFPSFSHPTLGNHEKRQNPFSCFIVSFPKPFPPHSWEPWLHELWLSFPPSQVCIILCYTIIFYHYRIYSYVYRYMYIYIYTYSCICTI